jgi:hypothetical protein
MAFTLLATDVDNIQQTLIALAKLSVVLVLVIITMFVVRWAMTYDQRSMERRNRYVEWYDQVVNDPNIDRKQLLKLAKLRGMASPIFYQAVQEKLDGYGPTTNTIEATMSPVQLYEIGNPLWTTGLSVNTIRRFLMLHQLTNKEGVNPHGYLEAYVADVRAGESARVAYDKQEANLKYNH